MQYCPARTGILRRITIALALILVCEFAIALSPGDVAPKFSLNDSTGKTHNLADYLGKFVVLEWVNYECPFVKKHYDSNGMQSLQAKIVGDDVVWLSICSSGKGKQGHFDADEIQRRMSALATSCTGYLIDEDGSIGRLYGAKTTPHMFIVDQQGILIYQGAIDSIPSVQAEDVPLAENYVLSVITSARSGQQIDTAVTKPYGCSVKYKD